MWNIYRHFKGMLYLKLGTSKHSETLEDFVVYLAMYNNPLGKLWIRPKEMFEGNRENNASITKEPRFKHIGSIEICKPSEISELLSFGYDAWGDKMNMIEFINSYQKSPEHLKGIRYVLKSVEGKLLSGLNLLRLADDVFGIASVVTNPKERRKGFAELLLSSVMCLQENSHGVCNFALFSEIKKEYYMKMGFGELPIQFQNFLPSVAMMRGNTDNFSWASKYF